MCNGPFKGPRRARATASTAHRRRPVSGGSARGARVAVPVAFRGDRASRSVAASNCRANRAVVRGIWSPSGVPCDWRMAVGMNCGVSAARGSGRSCRAAGRTPGADGIHLVGRGRAGRPARGSRFGKSMAAAAGALLVTGLWAGLVDDVEGRLGDPAECCVPGVRGKPPYRLLTGLGAERVAAVLGQRVRHAQEGRE